jgi:hypothetical protein
MQQQIQLKRQDAITALKNMKLFHDECRSLFRKHGFDLLDNLGRRNILLSQAQEKFFADALSKRYKGVINDGRTGQPDILIKSLGKELECKLTSRHKGGAISFQSDYGALIQKGALDYLYVIADDNFEKFVVLHFQNLTIEDFRPLSSGSRGKVAMYKHKGLEKCNVLVGRVDNNKEAHINRLHEKLADTDLSPYARQRAQKSLKYWEAAPGTYSFIFEGLDES